MTYEQLLAQQPPSDASGNRAAAAAFVVVLTTAIEGAGIDALSPAQKNYLYRLRATWQKRAAGDDLRWNVAGSRPGRPRKWTDVPKVRKRDPGEDDPLFQSLMRKYGTPIGDPE